MSEHKDALNAMDGIPASVGFCEPAEGYRYRPHDAVRSMREMASEITSLHQQLEQAQARVAELEADNQHQRERRNAARECIVRMRDAAPSAKILDVANCRTDFWATAIGGYQPRRGDCLYLMEAPGD